MKKILLIFFLVIPLYAITQIKVLFIGNSLTAWFNQPVKFENLAISAGKSVYVVNGTIVGHKLSQLIESDVVLNKIRSEKWDYIILQDSRYEIIYADYHEAMNVTIDAFKDVIYTNHQDTRIIYFLDYPLINGITIAGVEYSYNEFQNLLTAGTIEFVGESMIIAPIGEAFRGTYNEYPSYDLYDIDDVHPSNIGGYLSACVYFSTIFNESCLGNKFHDELTETIADNLQRIATNVVLETPDKWNIVDPPNTGTTAIENFYLESNEISFYPNPANEFLNFELRSEGYSRIEIIELISGKKVYSENLYDDKTQINISELNSGTFILKLVNEKGAKVKKFIKL